MSENFLREAWRSYRADQLNEAERLCLQALLADPSNADALFLRGLLAEQSGQLEHALGYYQDILDKYPAHGQALYRCGLLLQHWGEFSLAKQYFQQVIHSEPKSPQAYYQLGLQAQLQNELSVAEHYTLQALTFDPNYGEAWLNLANIARKRGQAEKAISICYQALQHNPTLIGAYNNLGNLLQEQGQWDEALGVYQQGLQHEPCSTSLHNNLGTVYVQQRRFDLAKFHFQTAIALQSESPEAYENLAPLLRQEGYHLEYRACEEKLLQLSLGHAAVRIRLATLLPIIYHDQAELTLWRNRLHEELTSLLHQPLLLAEPLSAGVTLFYLPYQGGPDKSLLLLLAQLYRKICPSLTYTAPHCLPEYVSPPTGKIKLGFISKHFRPGHTISKLFHGLIYHLSRDHFQVTLFSFNEIQLNRSTGLFPEECHVLLFPELLPAREQIAAQRLDILFYTDIGMEPLTYFLAFARLAPIQCVTWGHGITSGLKTLDYFLSSQALETPQAQEYYSESLVQMEHLLPYYERPILPTDLNPRAFFGLSEESHLYICPQNLFKFHPDFDGLLAAILRGDPKGELILIQGECVHWTHLLQERFLLSMPDVVPRIRFLERQAYPDFLNLLAVADVMLDPLYFGGGNSSYEALALGLPIVTLPTEMLKGRITLALYKKMEFMRCVADNPASYISIALQLGTSSPLRAETASDILAKCGVLYENIPAIRELEQVLIQLWEKREISPLDSAASEKA